MSEGRQSSDPAISNEVVRAMGNELKRLREDYAAMEVSCKNIRNVRQNVKNGAKSRSETPSSKLRIFVFSES